MKRVTRGFAPLIAMAGMMALGGTSARAGINLVADGGFESGGFAPAWTTTFDGGNDLVTADFRVDEVLPHSGDFAAHYLTDGSLTVGNATLSQTLSTVAGQDYVVNFFAVNRSFDRHDQASVQVYFGGDAATPTPVFIARSTDHAEYSYSVHAIGPSTVLTFQFHFQIDFEPADTFVDDIRVTAVPVPEPSSSALCGIASLACLGWRLRRGRSGVAA